MRSDKRRDGREVGAMQMLGEGPAERRKAYLPLPDRIDSSDLPAIVEAKLRLVFLQQSPPDEERAAGVRDAAAQPLLNHGKFPGILEANAIRMEMWIEPADARMCAHDLEIGRASCRERV